MTMTIDEVLEASRRGAKEAERHERERRAESKFRRATMERLSRQRAEGRMVRGAGRLRS